MQLGLSVSLRARMRLHVLVLETFNGDVGVDLGRCEGGVPQHFLDAAEVRTRIKKMRRETVAQFVWCEVRREFRKS